MRAIENDEARTRVHKLYNPLQRSFNELVDSYSDEELEIIVSFTHKTNAMFHAAVDALPDSTLRPKCQGQ